MWATRAAGHDDGHRDRETGPAHFALVYTTVNPAGSSGRGSGGYRRTARWLTAALMAALCAGGGVARAGDGDASSKAAAPVVMEPEAGGQHARLDTAHGAVHVWIPPDYHPAEAGVVVYVHGYYTDVDHAWREHHLAEQFRQSGLDALFIAPEAPAHASEGVSWTDIDALLIEVKRQTDLLRPWGPVVGVFHSGGYRTAVDWLDQGQLDQIILLDALYGDEDAFRVWLDRARGPVKNQLILVGADTVRWTEPLVRKLVAGGMPVSQFDRLPDRAAEVSEAARRAPVLYFRAQYGHMDLVTSGAVIPMLLDLTRLAPRPASPRASGEPPR